MTEGQQPQLTVAAAAASSTPRQEDITEDVFDAELGVAGRQLIDSVSRLPGSIRLCEDWICALSGWVLLRFFQHL